MHVEGQGRMPELVQIAFPMAVLLAREEPDPSSIGHPASGASGLCRICLNVAGSSYSALGWQIMWVSVGSEVAVALFPFDMSGPAAREMCFRRLGRREILQRSLAGKVRQVSARLGNRSPVSCGLNPLCGCRFVGSVESNVLPRRPPVSSRVASSSLRSREFAV